MPANLHDRAVQFFRNLQDEIAGELARADGSAFDEDVWEYSNGEGGGRTRVLMNGGLFEKAGVNVSAVGGLFPDDFARTMPGSGQAFRAAGISLVLHPLNPRIPTVHANFRHLERGDAGWFGGGADLTPYLPYREDIVGFHRTWQACCQRHPQTADYAEFKSACDRYFYLPHRQEARGVGGIFFDYMTQEPEASFDFVRDAGESFLAAYLPILNRRRDEPYTQVERDFQLFRRGRYVEFNLVYDRGTLFGLKTNGRIESILMSLPPTVSWLYNRRPTPASWEAELYRCLEPQDWVDDPPLGR